MKLYLDTIKPAVEAADPTVAFAGGVGRAFVDSSPSNGMVSATDELYVKARLSERDAARKECRSSQRKRNRRDALSVKRWNESGAYEYGDLHYYNYADDCEDWTTYPTARFISEHGFQSFPSFDR